MKGALRHSVPMTEKVDVEAEKKRFEARMGEAKQFENKLASQVFKVEKDGITARFKGTGEPISIDIPPNMGRKAMNNAVLAVMTEGYWTAAKLRDQKVKEMFPT